MEDVVRITAPASEPLTLDEFKSHAHVDTDVDDSYISNILIPTVRGLAESELQRALITQTWELRLDQFPGVDPRYESPGYPTIYLPKPPFQSIVSFTYRDTSGVLQTMVACNADGTTPDGQFYGYQLDPGSESQPARLIPPWAKPWPPARRMPTAVRVQFKCGYGELAGSPLAWTPREIPPEIRSAMLLAGAHLYDNRWGVDDQALQEIPLGVKTLFAPWVNRLS